MTNQIRIGSGIHRSDSLCCWIIFLVACIDKHTSTTFGRSDTFFFLSKLQDQQEWFVCGSDVFVSKIKGLWREFSQIKRFYEGNFLKLKDVVNVVLRH